LFYKINTENATEGNGDWKHPYWEPPHSGLIPGDENGVSVPRLGSARGYFLKQPQLVYINSKDKMTQFKKIVNRMVAIQRQQRKQFGRGRGRGQRRTIVPFNRFNPRYRIMYGQQQDYAFTPKFKTKNKKNRRGMGKTFTTPVSESKIVQSYFKFNNDTITFCQPIPTIMYILSSATIPIHPMFYFGRTANMALNFANFQITNVVIHYVPLIGTTSAGMVAIGSTRNCTPLTYLTTSQFNGITQINAEINPVWMCSKFQVKDLDNGIKNMAPVTRNDIPNNVYVIGNGLIGTMANSCNIFIEMTIKLLRPSPSPTLTPIATLVQFVTSALGVMSNTVITGNTHGIVINSSAVNIDMGEYVQVGSFPVVATDYLLDFSHNNAMVDYANVNDQGTIYCLIFTES